MSSWFSQWRLRAILPVVGVLAIGLILFEIALQTLETPNHPWIFLVAVSGAIAICAVVLVTLAVLIQRPLVEMNEKVSRLRDGDLSVQLDFATRHDEIGELGRHFNEMVVQLRQNREEIERLHREQMSRAEHLATMGQLATGLAHEIRNPLAGIAGAIEIIVRDLPAESPRREVLEDVRREVKRIHGILSDLLVYARPQPPRLAPGAINATAVRAIRLAREQIRSRSIEIRFSPSPDRVLVIHDPGQIEQVLLNLLFNGIQAIQDAGIIDVALSQEGGFAVVTISDTGRGIPTDDLPKIFRPFFTTKQRGTGLGLPLAKGIVEDHGGQITAISEVGRGTTFIVRLPIAPPGVTAETPAPLVLQQNRIERT